MNATRRAFLLLAARLGAVSAAGALGLSAAALGQSPGARVVVVGGGFAGATCAKYLRRADPSLQVTLIERARRYVTGPASNLVLAGLRSLADITFGYEELNRAHGVRLVYGNAISIDVAGKKVALAGGQSVPYDRLVVAPGIEPKYGAIEGYDEQAAMLMPHAWEPGAQTDLLHRRLEALRNGDVVIIGIPPLPFRCPPGPFERASLIAHYLKRDKPRSKVLVLDANDSFPDQELFFEAWQALYPGMIEWVPGSKGGRITRVDPNSMTVLTATGAHKGGVVNVIPPERAGRIAADAGLADDTGWCPVETRSFESTKHRGIHVIGDSAIAGQLPKSASAANSQAKVCAAAIADLLAGRAVGEPSFVNACYSLVAPTYGISLTAVYGVAAQGIVALKGTYGASPLGASTKYRQKEAADAEGWYQNIVADSFA